ncbi:hypothetical protein D3C84_810620 [compost metagenome]
MQGERRDLVVQAEHERGDGLRREVHVARLVGADTTIAPGRYAVVPVDMDCFHASQADVQRAIDRRTGAFQDADHGEGLVVVLDQADRRHAVGQYQFCTECVVQRLSHFGTQHHLERVRGEGSAAGQLQVLLTPVLIVLEVGVGGAHHPVATM